MLLAAHAMLGVLSIRTADLSADETDHYSYALTVPAGHPDRDRLHYDSKMPVSTLNLLFRVIAEVLDPPTRTRYPGRDDVFRGRYVTIAASVALGALVHTFAVRLYGARAGLLALFLFAFSPTAIAHGRLVTTDTFAALGVTGAIYAFWRYARKGEGRWRCAAALVTGLAQLAKYTCIFLYPIFLTIGVLRAGPRLRAALVTRTPAVITVGIRRTLGTAALFAISGLICLNVGFALRGTMVPLAEYHFQSRELSRLQEAAGRFSAAPVPVPRPYLMGLDMVRDHEQAGKQWGNLYLLGESQEGAERVGFKSYYLVAYALKEPLAYQALLLAAAAGYIARRRGRAFLHDEVFLVVPIIAYVLLLSFALRAQLGVRYLLAVLPLAYVFTSWLVRAEVRITRTRAAVLVTFLLYGAVSTLSYHPHYISYMNEVVWDRTTLYRYLGGSDLDWSLSTSSLRRYVKARVDGSIHVDPEQPTAGTVIVRASTLQTREGQARYRWLTERLAPAGHIDYVYLIYEVRPTDLEGIETRGLP